MLLNIMTEAMISYTILGVVVTTGTVVICWYVTKSHNGGN